MSQYADLSAPRQPVPPLPLPSDARALARPLRMKVGGYVEMSFDAYLELDGITWLRAEGGFGDGQRTNWHRREDWVAMTPGIACSVGRYFEHPDHWGRGLGARNTKPTSIHAAMRAELIDKLRYSDHSLREAQEKLARLTTGRNLIRASVGKALGRTP